MKITTNLSALMFLVLSVSSGGAEDAPLAVQDVLTAFPEAAFMKPSLSVLHLRREQSYKKIGSITYELRFVRYVDPQKHADGKSLINLIKDSKLENEKLKVMPIEQGPVKIYTFIQSDALKAKGISIVLSVRPLEEGEILARE